jgi:hypothetical protein
MTKGHEVGYGRPPIDTRFKPGQSGNPAGRPKRSPSFRTELLEELAEMAPGGDPITKQRAAIRALIQEATGGNLRALSVLFGYLAKTAGLEEANDAAMPDEDKELLQAYLERELKRRGVDDGTAAQNPTID